VLFRIGACVALTAILACSGPGLCWRQFGSGGGPARDTFSYARGRHGLSLILAQGRHPGLSYNVRF
jgi:hypothetical protein